MSTAYVGQYPVPDIRRRRIAATMYVVVGRRAQRFARRQERRATFAAAIILGVIALYHFLAAWPLRVDQTESLAVASRAVGFPVGHASAQLRMARLAQPAGVADPCS